MPYALHLITETTNTFFSYLSDTRLLEFKVHSVYPLLTYCFTRPNNSTKFYYLKKGFFVDGKNVDDTTAGLSGTAGGPRAADGGAIGISKISDS